LCIKSTMTRRLGRLRVFGIRPEEYSSCRTMLKVAEETWEVDQIAVIMFFLPNSSLGGREIL